MITNVNTYTKMLKTAYSCQNIGHIETTESWAYKVYESRSLTRFEYKHIVKVLNDRQKNLSERYNNSQE